MKVERDTRRDGWPKDRSCSKVPLKMRIENRKENE